MSKPPGMTWEQWRKHRKCTRKVKMGNEATARGRAGPMNKEAYLCPYCGYWHIGDRS